MKKYYLFIFIFFIFQTYLISQDKVKDLFEKSWVTEDTTQKRLLREQIVKSSPESEFGLFCKAWFYDIENDKEKAIEYYTKAINKNKSFWQAYVNRGITYFDLKDYDNSLTDYNTVLKLKPDIKKEWKDVFWLYYEIGRTNYMKGDFQSAIINYTTSIETAKENSIICYLYLFRGYCYQENRNYEKAIEDFSKAIEYNPNIDNIFQIYYKRGDCYYKYKNYQLALMDFSKSIELKSDFLDAILYRGKANRKLKNYDDAIFDFTKAIELNPDNPDAYFNRGLTLKDLNKDNEAMADYNKVIELDPNYSSAYNNRGNIYDKLEQFDNAISDYKKAIETNPEDRIAKDNLKIIQEKINNQKYSLKYDYIEYSFGESKFTFYSDGKVVNEDLNAKGIWKQDGAGITIELFSLKYMMNLYLMSYDCCLGELNSIKVFDPNDFSKQYIMKKLKEK
ncbi:MAG TPA: tetratricopeptide repeat protein [Ignavibacteria bacterium]